MTTLKWVNKDETCHTFPYFLRCIVKPPCRDGITATEERRADAPRSTEERCVELLCCAEEPRIFNVEGLCCAEERYAEAPRFTEDPTTRSRNGYCR